MAAFHRKNLTSIHESHSYSSLIVKWEKNVDVEIHLHVCPKQLVFPDCQFCLAL